MRRTGGPENQHENEQDVIESGQHVLEAGPHEADEVGRDRMDRGIVERIEGHRQHADTLVAASARVGAVHAHDVDRSLGQGWPLVAFAGQRHRGTGGRARKTQPHADHRVGQLQRRVGG